MKKNAMLKIAAVLLVAVLLTTCAISSTFAKYATKGAAFTDSARVAKWGVTVNTELNAYNSGFKASYSSGEGSVKSIDNTTKLVAPGTSGTMTLKFQYSIVDPEVSGRISVRSNEDLDVTDEKNYLYVDPDLKARIAFTATVKSPDENGDLKLEETLTTVDAINNYLGEFSTTFTPGDQETSVNKVIDITWIWKFEEDKDNLDTELGNDGTAPIEFNFYIDIVQTGPAVDEN